MQCHIEISEDTDRLTSHIYKIKGSILTFLCSFLESRKLLKLFFPSVPNLILMFSSGFLSGRVHTKVVQEHYDTYSEILNLHERRQKEAVLHNCMYIKRGVILAGINCNCKYNCRNQDTVVICTILRGNKRLDCRQRGEEQCKSNT